MCEQIPKPKNLIALLVVLLAILACSNTPIVEERVIAVTATPIVNLEAELTETPQPTSTLRPVPTQGPTATSRPTGIPTPRPTSTPRPTPTPRAWPFSDKDGAWFINSEKDPLTDRERIFAAVRPTDPTAAADSGFVVRCGFAKSDVAEVYVTFRHEVPESLWLEVQWRFDDGEIETQRWGPVANTSLAYLYAPTEFIWQMMHAQTLVIREEGGQTLTFDVSGLANALYPYRDKCNWIQP